MQLSGLVPWIFSDNEFCTDDSSSSLSRGSDSSLANEDDVKMSLVGDEDLRHLDCLVEGKDGGREWIPIMDKNGPPQYRSRTVFEYVTPELVRDFFWDDEFRKKWDYMLIHSSTLDECHVTGTMLVHWIRKFPLFCSDREYTIARRIWEPARSYFCVTKGVPSSAIPRRSKPRRVDLYYSSWRIRAAESKAGDGRLTSTEVILFHHEDMGISWEVAKLGVRQGMWGAVKKIELGLQAYKKQRASNSKISGSAFMAQINTKISPGQLISSKESSTILSEADNSDLVKSKIKSSVPKLVIIGGAVAVACSLDRGLLTKAVLFGVASRLARILKKG